MYTSLGMFRVCDIPFFLCGPPSTQSTSLPGVLSSTKSLISFRVQSPRHRTRRVHINIGSRGAIARLLVYQHFSLQDDVQPSVATSSAQPSAEILQEPILPICIWSQVFDHFQAFDNLDGIVWLCIDARHISVPFEYRIEILFKLKYPPLV